MVSELKALNKPFIIIINSNEPNSSYTKELAKKLSEKYETSVLPIDCQNLNIEDINKIFSNVLYEFPIEQISIKFPRWIDGIDFDHPLKAELYNEIKDAFADIKVLKQVSNCIEKIKQTNIIEKTSIENIQLGSRNC